MQAIAKVTINSTTSKVNQTKNPNSIDVKASAIPNNYRELNFFKIYLFFFCLWMNLATTGFYVFLLFTCFKTKTICILGRHTVRINLNELLTCSNTCNKILLLGCTTKKWDWCYNACFKNQCTVHLLINSNRYIFVNSRWKI